MAALGRDVPETLLAWGLSRLLHTPNIMVEGRGERRSMASAAEDLGPFGVPAASVEKRWRTIQIAMLDLPDQAIPALLSDFMRAIADVHGGENPSAVAEFLDDWYRRALFARAQTRRPAEAVLTVEDWNELPDRSF